jgi:hypothetical protein
VCSDSVCERTPASCYAGVLSCVRMADLIQRLRVPPHSSLAHTLICIATTTLAVRQCMQDCRAADKPNRSLVIACKKDCPSSPEWSPQDTWIGAPAGIAMPAQLLSGCVPCSVQAVAHEAVFSRPSMQTCHQPRVQQQLVSLRSFAAAPPGLRHRTASARLRTTAAAGAHITTHCHSRLQSTNRYMCRLATVIMFGNCRSGRRCRLCGVPLHAGHTGF